MSETLPIVLIVDDDDAIRGLIRDVLADEGYTVEEAGNGREALAVLQRLPVSCVLLVDLLMPKVDGWQFIEQVRADELRRSTPIVVMSSSITFQRIPPNVTFLEKPFRINRLVTTIRRCHEPAPGGAAGV